VAHGDDDRDRIAKLGERIVKLFELANSVGPDGKPTEEARTAAVTACRLAKEHGFAIVKLNGHASAPPPWGWHARPTGTGAPPPASSSSSSSTTSARGPFVSAIADFFRDVVVPAGVEVLAEQGALKRQRRAMRRERRRRRKANANVKGR
jgi:hypothetical protein